MFSIETKGPWKQFRNLIKGYPRRIKYVERRIGLDLAKSFLEKVKEGVPAGEEYKVYSDSLRVVEITGSNTPMFAVISDKEKEKVGDIKKGSRLSKTVVYIYPSAGELSSEVLSLLESGNPWPSDMVPNGISRDDVSLVHRTVTEGEVEWARDRVKAIIRQYKGEFRRHGISWGKAAEDEKSADGMESMPDYMSLAIRTEFGINATPSPHWRPAMKWILSNAVDVIRKDKKIKAALHDSLFRDHTMSFSSGEKQMSLRDFKKEAEAFEKKVVN